MKHDVYSYRQRNLLRIIFFAGVILMMTTAMTFAASAPSATGKITESDGVNIRAGASTGTSIVGTLPSSSTVTILEEKHTQSGSISDTDIWYRIESAYGDGYIRSDLASVTYSSVTAKATEEVNIRKGPGTEFSKMGTLADGASATVVLKAISSSGGTWYKIKQGSNYYYVSGSYLSFTGSSGSSDSSSSGSSGSSSSTNTTNQSYSELLAEFPQSYKTLLQSLHASHPNWIFKAKTMDYTWEEALKKQCSNASANTISANFAEAYKEVKSGTYNFTTHTYIAKDGANWVAASKEAVAYYMDPRNWLTESGIFMFSPSTYDATRDTKDVVSKILQTTALPESAAEYYMEAAIQDYGGTTYEISPVYLATKTRLELGSSAFMINGHSFTYGGKDYSKCYNPYNIGASDSADGSAATRGLVYAAGGSDGSGTSYLRPWNTLRKGIKGGALYIAVNYLADNQHTAYYERFNVCNGLDSIGTYQYATSTFAAATTGSILYSSYKDIGISDEAFVFEIPVYKEMPSEASPRPSSTGNNNNYLDSIKVYSGNTQLALNKTFSRFTSNYTLKNTVASDVDEVTVNAVANVDDAKIVVSNNTDLEYGENKVRIKVTSSTGRVRNYYVTVEREAPTELPKTPTNVSVKSNGIDNVTLTWKGDSLATGYEVYWKHTGAEKWAYNTVKNKTTWTKTMATKGADYEYKVRAYYQYGDERIYSADYSETVSMPSFGDISAVKGSLYDHFRNVKLTWEPVANADGYVVYYKQSTASKWSSTEVTEAEFEKKMSYAGKKYQFKISPYRIIGDEKYICPQTSSVKAIYTLKKPTVTLSKKSTKSIVVKWNNLNGESGYEVYRALKKNGNYTLRKTTAAGKTTYTNTGLTKGKRYYYKVRAFKNTVYDTVVYSAYSDIVSLKR